MAQTEFSKLEEFLIGLQRSWEEAMKSMKAAQKSMKKQFNKKQRNPQELKIGDNMLWQLLIMITNDNTGE